LFIEMKVLLRRILCGAIGVFLLCDGAAQPGPDEPVYKSGYSSIMKLGQAIYKFLEPGQRQLLSPQPISIETDVTPFVRLLFYPGEGQPIRGVWISAGFIDLANNVAHAKAIDGKNPGYFDRYVKLLAS